MKEKAFPAALIVFLCWCICTTESPGQSTEPRITRLEILCPVYQTCEDTNGVTYRTFLSNAVLAVWEAVPTNGGYVFANPQTNAEISELINKAEKSSENPVNKSKKIVNNPQ